MRTFCCSVLAICIVLGTVTRPAARAQRRDDDERRRAAAAVIAATVAGAAVVAAAKERERERERERWRSIYRYRNDLRRFDENRVWSPARHVTCYARLRQCYEAGKGYNAKWTRREFF